MSDSSTTTKGASDRDASDVAREQGQQVKGTAQHAASNVTTTAGEKARDIKGQAGSHAHGIAGEAGRQVRDRAEQETERAGSALRQAGSQLQALAQGRADEAGVFGEYAQQAADTVNRWAESVQERGLDGLLDDLRSFARRRPGVFLVSAAAAGVIAGRFGRNLREELSDGDSRSVASSASETTARSSESTARSSESSATGDQAAGGTQDQHDRHVGVYDRRSEPVIEEGPRGAAVEDRPGEGDVDYESIDVNRRRMS